MKSELFREIINRRIYVENISQGEWQEEIEKCWKMELDVLTEDIPSTILFLKNECTADEYSWISEIIDDIAEKTNGHELIACYKNLMKKFPNECRKYNIADSIKIAEALLNEKTNRINENKAIENIY